jgi:L-lysine 2,3-aminomutase
MSAATPLDSTIHPRPIPWQRVLRDAVTDVAELAALLDLPASALAGHDAPAAGSPAADAPERRFPLRVPHGFVARMRKRDPRDPLLLQVLPQAREATAVPGYTADPVGEVGLAARGVVRKYAGRVLLIASGACPIHCRYCFRREFPYRSQLALRGDWAEAVAALGGMPDVGEVILSGGDPLSLGNRRLERLFDAVAEIGTVRRVRIHTRFPIVVPERVDEGLLALLERTPLASVVVVHVNHANEIDAPVASALAALGRAGATLLNQSVLLRDVNDDADVLAQLCERLFSCGVLPYYLHLLDPVAGAAHFDVDERRGRALHAQLRARLPGYLVPRLVREIPGRPSKTTIA